MKNNEQPDKNDEILMVKILEEGEYDIIGDVHGSYSLLIGLLKKLNYRIDEKTFEVTHLDNRKLVFVGDLIDRGENDEKVLKLITRMYEENKCFVVRGNHEQKYIKAFEKKNGKKSEKLYHDVNIEEIEKYLFFVSLPYQIILKHLNCIVTHAAVPIDNTTKAESMKRISIYGYSKGKDLLTGYPIRDDWAKKYSGEELIVHGHQIVENVRSFNNTLNLDLGAFRSQKIAAFSLPEKKITIHRKSRQKINNYNNVVEGEKLFRSNVFPVVKLVIPFHFSNENFIEFDSVVSKSKSWDLINETNKKTELYAHIDKLSYGNDNMQSYIFKKYNCIDKRFIMDLKINAFIKKVEREIFIKGINLFLFRTSVGFLEIILDTQSLQTVGGLTTFLNDIKSINHTEITVERFKNETINLSKDNMSVQMLDKNSIYVPKDKGNSSEVGMYIDHELLDEAHVNEFDLNTIQPNLKVTRKMCENVKFKDYLRSIFDLMSEVKFFNGFSYEKTNEAGEAETIELPYKANIFTVTLSDENQNSEICFEQFMRMIKGYSEKYNVIKNNLYAENSIYQPFQNIYWGFSKEGVANYVDLVGNEGENFLKNERNERMEIDFELYIIALNQYFGLLRYASVISELPSKPSDYYSNVNDVLEINENYTLLENIRNEINFFYMKCFYTDVSHITHENTVYQKMVEVLGINKLMDELDHELNSVHSIVERTLNDIKVSQEKKSFIKKELERDKRELFFQFLSIFGMIAIFEAVVNLLNYSNIVTGYRKGIDIGIALEFIVAILITIVLFMSAKIIYQSVVSKMKK